jgi:hypothetical protein
MLAELQMKELSGCKSKDELLLIVRQHRLFRRIKAPITTFIAQPKLAACFVSNASRPRHPHPTPPFGLRALEKSFSISREKISKWSASMSVGLLRCRNTSGVGGKPDSSRTLEWVAQGPVYGIDCEIDASSSSLQAAPSAMRALRSSDVSASSCCTSRARMTRLIR